MIKISREAEIKIPRFHNHDEARTYFKNKYGNLFMLMKSEIIAEEKIYFYSLILDEKNFLNGQKELSEGQTLLGFKYLESYQAIEIFEDGRVHIIH